MSTRAQIVCFSESKHYSSDENDPSQEIEAKQLVRLYRHCDGYPNGLGNDLKV